MLGTQVFCFDVSRHKYGGMKTTTEIFDHNSALLSVFLIACLAVGMKVVSRRSPLLYSEVCLLIGVDWKLWYVNTRLLAQNFSASVLLNKEVLCWQLLLAVAGSNRLLSPYAKDSEPNLTWTRGCSGLSFLDRSKSVPRQLSRQTSLFPYS